MQTILGVHMPDHMHGEMNDWIAAEGTTCCASEDRVAEVSGKLVLEIAIVTLALREYEGCSVQDNCREVEDAQKVWTPCLTDWLADAGLGAKSS